MRTIRIRYKGWRIDPLGRWCILRLKSGAILSLRRNGDAVYISRGGRLKLQVPASSSLYDSLFKLRRRVNYLMDRPVSFAGGDW
ncbi:holin [Thermus phage G20c]|nr:holin [Thermus phage G20c]